MGHLAMATDQAGGATQSAGTRGATGAPQGQLMTPFAPATPLAANEQAVVSWPYSGRECAENKRGYERGYLELSRGAHVTILSGAQAGHTTNPFPFYVFCETRNGTRGWVPQLCLHREGYGSYGVVSGLEGSNELNNTLVHLRGQRDDGRL